MKSAYGRQTPPPDYELTCVEAGSPMGELLRRYWQPVCPSDELKDLPKKVKILGEEIVVFRDKKGRVGALEPHCAHRGASLEWGRIEERGIRCCYHGWLYDTHGQCLDMPCETEEFRKKMDIWQEAYPTLEYGGLVFAYMGPPGTAPLFPMYDIVDTRYRNDVELRGMRVWGEFSAGYVKDCNWLQHYENIVDPYHLLMLHKVISGDQFVGAMMQGSPQLSLEKTSLGVRYRFVNDLPNGNRLVRYVECVVPNMFLIANIHEPGTVPMRKDRASELSWVVPVDNESMRGLSIVCWPLDDNGAPQADWTPRTAAEIPERAGSNTNRSYEARQRNPDDLEAQEGQRPIAVHALENLAPSDIGVVWLRQMLREQIKRVEGGFDPTNTWRDPAANHKITTNAWNTVLSPEEARAHQGEEI
jgi:nitrite reductase/ring-hydroxylating ferredoxin subunit